MAATPLFFDHNSSTPVSPRVEKRMLEVLHEFYGNPHSQTHRHGWYAANLISEHSYDISSYFSADFHTVFTSGATEANNLAFNLKRLPDRPNVLIGPLEHSAVTEPADRLAQSLGGELITIPCNEEGYIDLEFVTDEVLARCAIVSVGFASGEIGTVQTKLEKLRDRAKESGAWFHSDMSQALQHPKAQQFGRGCDAISISGHKIYGPQGVGALIVTQEFRSALEPMLIGGGQQDGIRAGTIPTFLCAGLAEALNETSDWIESGSSSDLNDSVQLFFKMLEGEIENGPANPIKIIGPENFADRVPGNLTVLLPKGLDASDLLMASSEKFSASQGSACHSGQETASPSLRAIRITDMEARRIIRFGLGRATIKKDITTVVDEIGRLIRTTKRK